PLFSFVLFLITFLSVFLPFIQPLYLFIWQTVDQYFFTLAPTGIESSLSQWPQYCRWGYLLFLHLLHSKKRPFHEN
ncbi:MAG: hypothetical protein KDD50_13645, partial [Bdellovibrionales bacterium]|nr:hypothetical protein [Bdellovibrionales bacterium]